MNKNIIITLIAVVIIIFGGAYIFTINSQGSSQSDQEIKNVGEGTVAEEEASKADKNDAVTAGVETEVFAGSFTMAEVREHNSAESCWVVINGFVYDETDWISRHPGGSSRILNICGTNATEKFTGQHSMSARAQAQLAEMKIGKLAS